MYKLKIQSFNQNICCIKDGSRLYAEIKNEEAQVQSEAFGMKLRKWVVRSNFLIQTWFFGSFFIKKKWTEENPFEQQFLIQTKKVNQITTWVKSQYNKQDSTSSTEWQLYWYHWYLVSRSMPKMLKQVQHDKDVPFLEICHIPQRESHSGISLILCCSLRGKDQNTMLRFWSACHTELVSVSE